MTARDPLRLLFAMIVAELGLLMASWLVPPTETSFAVQRWAGLALGIGLTFAIGWMQRLRRGAESEPLWTAALIVSLIELGLDLVGQLGGSSLWLAAIVPMIAGTASWILLWLALTRDGGPERGARLTPLFIGLAVVRLAATLVRLWLSVNRIGSAAELGSTFVAIGWVSLLGSFAVRGLLLFVIFRLVTAEDGAIAPVQRSAESAPAPAASRGRDLAFGAAWLTAGLVVTAISFGSASHDAAGGRYVVMTGAIGYGLVRIVRALARR